MSAPPLALITGGTRGVGLATAHALATDGYDLALLYLSDDIAAAAARAALQGACRVMTLAADVSNKAEAAATVKRVREQFGRIDLLVNNVGPFVPKPLLETTLDDYELQVGGNLGSTVFMCQAVLPIMRTQGGGHIVNLGSLNAEMARGAPNVALYHALKVAVVSLSKSLARSEGPYNVRVNVVNPGMITLEGTRESIVDSIPLQRLGTAHEVANAIRWLASDEASYVTGAVINVNGGLFV
ncbi:MAG: SDR family oxidoreductase [Anaerolineales bacterium]|nr:SDR family oxidoreductase [Anaerolineales bacterium]MCB9129111.1 SDR family oxidoreductase [Ardenticatenales bacterium]